MTDVTKDLELILDILRADKDEVFRDYDPDIDPYYWELPEDEECHVTARRNRGR